MDENPVSRALMPAARLMALVAGYCLLGLAFLVTAEILLRRFMNVSLQGGDEFGGYTLAVVATFGFAYALLERAHTRVEILIERLRGGPQAWLNLVAVWCIALMAAFMAWRSVATLMESLEYRSLSGTPLMTPLWQPQAAWVAGLLFFALVAAAVAIHATVLAIRDRRRLNDFYGMKTLSEIIREERASALDGPKAPAP